jgi:hypothetical protein
MTHEQYMALPPQTKYQIEKERREARLEALYGKKLKEAKKIFDIPNPIHKGGRPKKGDKGRFTESAATAGRQNAGKNHAR